MIEQIKTVLQAKGCAPERGLAFQEVVHSLSGKWKLVLLCTIGSASMRFGELQKLLPDITPRVLSKELKELELSGLVNRTVPDAAPILYSLTDSALELVARIMALIDWGATHRKQNLGLR